MGIGRWVLRRRHRLSVPILCRLRGVYQCTSLCTGALEQHNACVHTVAPSKTQSGNCTVITWLIYIPTKIFTAVESAQVNW